MNAKERTGLAKLVLSVIKSRPLLVSAVADAMRDEIQKIETATVAARQIADALSGTDTAGVDGNGNA